MTTDHVHLARRASYRWWHALAALAIFPLIADAAGVNRNNVGRAGITQTGRTTTLTAGAPPVNSGGSTIPISPSTGGWTTAGNYGVPTSATGPNAGTLTANGHVVFRDGYRNGRNDWDVGGVKYPAQVSTPIPWGAVAGAAAGIVCAVATAGACGVAGAVAAASPYIMEWLDRGGFKRNPETGVIEKPTSPEEYIESDGYAYYVSWSGQSTGYRATKQLACAAAPAMVRAAYDAAGRPQVPVGGSELIGDHCKVEQDGGFFNHDVRQGGASDCPAGWYVTPFGCFSAANLPRIAVPIADIITRLGQVPPDPRVWGEVLDKGGTIDMPNPTVTGPSSIQGPETVRQNSDGTREVSRTTYNFTTAGNTITNTSNVTTTNTFNSSNVQTSSTTTTTTPSDDTPGAEEEEDTCAKHPEILGCQKIDFDTPDGEIPKQDKQITYAPESVLTGGSCPAPRELAYGRSFSYAATCDALTTYVRPMVIAIAGWIAIVIIFGVGRPE